MTTAPPQAELAARLSACRGVLFDIDGCLALFGDRAADAVALPGAAEIVRRVRASGRPLLAFTNASARSSAQIAAALTDLGVAVDPAEVLTPAVVAVEVALSRYAPRPVLPFGGPSLVEVLRDGGVPLLAEDADPAEAAAVIAGWDTRIEAERLQRAAQALWAGADLLVTSDARSFASSGRPTAGVSGFIAHGLAHVAGRDVEILGKPSTTAMTMAALRLGVEPSHLLVVGDDLGLEITMGLAVGAVTVLTTTGTHAAADAAQMPPERRPHLVVGGLDELITAWPELGATTASTPTTGSDAR